ncbi:MAG: hypothetical protein ACYDC3_15090, partial [Candidatus Binataceae bacterium]
TGFYQKDTLGLTGAQASLPAWTNFMKKATASRPALDFTAPPDMVVEPVDPTTGCKAAPGSSVSILGVFPKTMAPADPCLPHAGTIATSAPVIPAPPNPITDPND